MFNLISLNLKCPVCGTSFMDYKKPIDGKPSIRLEIELDDKKGQIWLSSIYGSYNLESEITIPEGAIARFACPHCHSKIVSEEKCYECNAPLVPFYLIEGGKVSICSRAGCKKHSIEFEDLNTALKHFYEDFAYSGRKVSIIRDEDGKSTRLEVEEADEREREIIASGTFLHSYCPHCKNTLIENNMLKFKVKKDKGEEGYLLLSPFLNVFNSESTIQLPENTRIEDICCWHCGTSLIDQEKDCPRCGEDCARISVAAMSKMVDFYICSKKGCTWHGLSDSDLKHIILEDSEEW